MEHDNLAKSKLGLGLTIGFLESTYGGKLYWPQASLSRAYASDTYNFSLWVKIDLPKSIILIILPNVGTL